MPSPKRKIFQIRQRQKARVKKNKLRIAMRNEHRVLKKQLVGVIFRLRKEFYGNCDNGTTPSDENISSIIVKIRKIKPKMHQFMARTMKIEKTIGKGEAGNYRHAILPYMNAISKYCGDIDRVFGTKLMEVLRE